MSSYRRIWPRWAALVTRPTRRGATTPNTLYAALDIQEDSRIVMQKHDAAKERVASLEEEIVHLREAKVC